MTRKIAVVLVVVACASVLARATSFTFSPQNGNSGYWSNQNDWAPNGVPGAGDSATIPTGKTCIVSSQNESITTLTVASGAVVRISGKDLTLALYNSTEPSISLSGKIEMEKPSSVTPRILVSGVLTFSGAGSIEASAADSLGPAEISGTSTTTRVVDLDLVTVHGHVHFKEYLELRNGYYTVDCADDTMFFGTLAFPVWPDYPYVFVGGQLEMNVTDGTIRFGSAVTDDNYVSLAGKFYVHSGLLEFTTYGWYLDTWATFGIYGGELKYGDQVGMGAWGGFSFEGGQIRLGQDSTVVFDEL
ncbi:hypothetical protein RAS1_27790 [Phycisphaerae bacterium RAS1]|nr:hypothetical protein RAS1_27790 [Phycisphaerae bacterium RAS1]